MTSRSASPWSRSGPRDGLQNEAAPLSVDDRVAFCDALLDAGLPVVEVGAFVSPKWVPQMAGSDEVLRARAEARRARARRCSCRTARATSAARDGGRARDRGLHGGQRDLQPQEHQRRRSTSRFAALRGVRARGARGRRSGCAATCRPASAAPTRDASTRRRWSRSCARLHDAGCDEISIGDTIGVGVPTQVTDVMGRLQDALPRERAGGPLPRHARHRARERAGRAARSASTIVDSSAGGLGGCPVRPGRQRQPGHRGPAVHAARHGHRDRRGPGRGDAASRALQPRLGRALPSRYLQAAPKD